MNPRITLTRSNGFDTTNGTIEIIWIVSQDEWLEARKKLLEKEKQFTRLQDELEIWSAAACPG